MVRINVLYALLSLLHRSHFGIYISLFLLLYSLLPSSFPEFTIPFLLILPSSLPLSFSRLYPLHPPFYFPPFLCFLATHFFPFPTFTPSFNSCSHNSFPSSNKSLTIIPLLSFASLTLLFTSFLCSFASYSLLAHSYLPPLPFSSYLISFPHPRSSSLSASHSFLIATPFLPSHFRPFPFTLSFFSICLPLHTNPLPSPPPLIRHSLLSDFPLI